MSDHPAHLPPKPTPHDKLTFAISMLQNHVMAAHSSLDGDRMFGTYYMPAVSLEHAVTLLTDLLGYLENVKEDEE